MTRDLGNQIPVAAPAIRDWLERGCVTPLQIWPSEPVSLLDNECILPDRSLVEGHYCWLPDTVLPVQVYRLQRVLVTWQGDLLSDGSPLEMANVLPGYVRSITETKLLQKKFRFDQQIQIAEGFLLLHNTFQTYGHFLLEMAPKLVVYAALRHVLGDLPIILLPETPQFIRGWIDFLVPGANCIVLQRDSVALVEKAVLADNLLTHYVGGIGLRFFIETCLSMASPQDLQPTRDRICISRKGHRASVNDFRILENAEAIEVALQLAGFEVIEPENFPIQTQILMFSRAKVIVGEMCSALHNTIFSREGTTVIQMNPFNRVQRAISLSRRQRLISLLPDDGILRGYPAAPDVNPAFTVDAARVLQAVRSHATIGDGTSR